MEGSRPSWICPQLEFLKLLYIVSNIQEKLKPTVFQRKEDQWPDYGKLKHLRTEKGEGTYE